jgi:hypothetical protein
MTKLERIFKRLRGLQQYKDFSDEQLKALAQEKVDKEVTDTDCFYVNEEEKKFAESLHAQYLEEYGVETSADKDTLQHLISLSVIRERIKKDMNKSYSEKDGAINTRMLETFNAVSEQIIETKESLGMTKKEAEKNQSDGVRAIEQMKLRFHAWINKAENKANFTVKCPCCSKFFLIRKRLDKMNEETMEHPWFIFGGILFNKHLFQMLSENKISREDVAKVLNASEDYIDWIYAHYKLETLQ